MKGKFHKIFWGICLIIAAFALILYAFGIDTGILSMPLYKLLAVLLIASHILSQIIFGNGLRDRLKIFAGLALIAILLEKSIAEWAGLADSNIFNNLAILSAGLIIDIALGIMIPKDKNKWNSGHNKFSSSTHYIDADKTKKYHINNKFGDSTVFYQNTDIADINVPLELNIDNKFGDVTVHIPEDWQVDNLIVTKFGEVCIRQNSGTGIRLILKGDNKFANVTVISP